MNQKAIFHETDQKRVRKSLLLTTGIFSALALIVLNVYFAQSMRKKTMLTIPSDQEIPLEAMISDRHFSENEIVEKGHAAPGKSQFIQNDRALRSEPTAEKYSLQSSSNPFDGNGIDGKDRKGGTSVQQDHSESFKKPEAVRRSLIQKPNSNAIHTDEAGYVALKVTVDAAGNVVGIPVVLRNQTTTDNPQVIQQVVALVCEQAKWNKVAGAGVLTTVVTIHLTAN